MVQRTGFSGHSVGRAQFWKGSAHSQLLWDGSRWLCCQLTSSCSNSESGFPMGFFQCFSFVTSSEHNEDSISTAFSTLCVTANNRAPCAVRRVYFAACYFPSLPQHFSWLFMWLFQRSRSVLLHTAFCEHPLTKWN